MLSIRRLYDVDKEVIVWRKIEKPGVGRPLLGPAKITKWWICSGEGLLTPGPTLSSFVTPAIFFYPKSY